MGVDLRQPLFFDKNRVYRSYIGGKLFSRFFGDDSEDDNYPEEWVASTVEAINVGHEKPNEGLSMIEGTDISFRELMERYPEQMCGPSGKFSVLVKMLDSAIRLPLQVHPDPEFSETYLNSQFGKTEMWIVLETREDAAIYFGFRDAMTKEKLAEYVERSKTEKHVMDGVLNRHPVKKGEVYLVPSRCVHAIGAGCLILEVQEPTDFTIEPEYWCGDLIRSEKQLYLGLGKDIALDCFDYSLCGEKSLEVARKIPKTISESENFKTEMLMSYEDTPCFQVKRHTIGCSTKWVAETPAIYVVTDGTGLIWSGSDGKRTLKKGDYFYLPYAAQGNCTIGSEERIEIVQCQPHL